MGPVLGSQVPQRGHAFSRAFGRMVLRLLGWRIEGGIPDLPKMVIIGAPHTSNMDGVLAFATLTAIGLRAGTMIKDSAFRGPLGVLLRWLGALPVNRRSPKGVVEQTIDAFASREQFVLLLAPEGTRSAAADWKKGYYHVARGAHVPILPACVHYRDRRIVFGPPLMPSGDYASDFTMLMGFYRTQSWPRHPERLSKPLAAVLNQRWQPRADED